MLRIVLFTGIVFLMGCSGQSVQPADLIACPEQRSAFCTRDYRPVCGYINGQSRTYGNGCSACAVSEVDGYIEGACPES